MGQIVRLLRALLLPLVAGIAGAQLPRASSDLRLTAPIDLWDEAVPLGNGLLGGLIWGGGNTVNISLDRGDLWDLRAAAPFGSPGYRWADLRRLVRERKEDSLHIRFDDPYDNTPYPTKIPGGRVVLEFAADRRVTSFSLSLARAEATVPLTEGELRGFFSATERVALFQFPAATTVRLARPTSLDQLGYEPGVFGAEGTEQWMIQHAALGLTYVIALGERRVGGQTLLAVTVATTTDGPDPLSIARRRLRAALDRGYAASLVPHLAWWRRFWGESSVAIPDTALQSHYDLVKYFYGAASRQGAPPMPLQGIWSADAGTLPPWKGDFHNDLNTQMSYLASHAAGLADASASWLDFNWKLLPAYRRFARDFYAVSGAAVPGVMSLDGAPLGGWAQYSLSPTMGAWVAQSFYLHWRYTMDARFLRERAYPFVAEIGTALAGLLESNDHGQLQLPLSTSPEIFDNSMKAWLPSSSSFDVSLLRWLFSALSEMAAAVHDSSGQQRWGAILARVEPLPVEPLGGALVFAAGLPYNESHRHFSHAMAIHPLGLLTVANTSDTATMRLTLDQIAERGTDWWCGYSFSWFSAMLARAGRSEEALHYLEVYRRAFVLRNGFHANGDQTRTGLSKYTYRPFTLEGNFLAMEAVQEMLLQSWGGAVRVFPAVSERWRDASFRDLRAEGGFRVSAQRVNGETVRLEVRSIAGGVLSLHDPFDGAPATWNRRDVRRDGSRYVVRLAPGERITAERLAPPERRP